MSQLATASASTAQAPNRVVDSCPKQLLIDGEWVDAASGKTFDTVNPANGEVLARVAEADKEDVDRAVTAARRAFESWSTQKPSKRTKLLLKIADAI
jgi:acyl-CoA reductase-like NAD-dependent aldehyde dehydrogenase